MKSADKTLLFEQMPVPRAVALLGIPTVISSLVMVLYSLADTYFVGRIGDPVQTAAVTLAAPVLLAFNAVNNLFGVGTASLMSRALGKKDTDTVRRTAAFGFYCALTAGLLFSFFATVFRPGLLRLLGADPETFDATGRYLFWTVTWGAAPAILNVVLSAMVRAEGSSVHAGIGTISGCLLNIVLDPVFISPRGLGMGAAGAGCATFISNCFSCGYFVLLVLIRRGKTYVCLNPRLFSLKKSIVLGVLAVGIPAAVQNLLNVTGMTVLNNFTSVYGTDAVAAMGIVHKINMVPMYFSMGLGQGIMPLVGYNYACGNADRMKKSIRFTAGIAVGFILVATAAYFVLADKIVFLFMSNPGIVRYGGAFLRRFCLGLPFLAVDFLAVGIFQAVGMGKESLIFAILRKVVLEIPALWILNRIYPLYGLSYSQLCAEVVVAAAAVWVLLRLFKRMDKTRPAGDTADPVPRRTDNAAR